MPYIDLDSDKFGYLLSNGTREGELKQFFADCFKRLILKGAKLRHPPSGRKDRIQTIVARLPRSSDDVVKQWFRDHITVEIPIEVTEIIEWFNVFNDGGGGLPEEEARRLARSALVHIFADAPDADLVSYLRHAPKTTIRSDKLDEAELPSEAPANPEPTATVAIQQVTQARLPKILAAAALGQNSLLQDLVADFPEETRVFVDGLLSARDGESQDLEVAIEALPIGSSERESLESLRGRARLDSVGDSLGREGLFVATPVPYAGELPAQLEIIGIATKDADSFTFVKPLVLSSGGLWVRLSPEDRMRLFPESGDVMIHRASGKRVPHVGEYVRWIVEEKLGVTGRTRFHLKEETARIYELVEVRAPSTDPDAVRHLVLELGRAIKRRSLQPFIFSLSDGLIIAPKSGDISKEESFDHPWLAWPAAEALLIEGRLLHFDLPRASPSFVDLAPLDVVLRRLVRSFVETERLVVTKRQLNELSDLVRSENIGLGDGRLRRLVHQLELVRLDRESIEQLEPIFFARPEVQSRINDYVDSEVSRRLETKAGILLEIDTARRRRDETLQEIKDCERQLKRAQTDTNDAVRNTFDEALRSGVKTLAEARIFRELSGLPEGGNQTGGRRVARLMPLQPVEGLRDVRQIVAAFEGMGIQRKLAYSLCVATQGAGEAGIALVLKGRVARQAARLLARYNVDRAVLIDVPLGFTDLCSFSATIQEAWKYSAIALLNANVAPLGLYGSSLLDAMYDFSLVGSSNMPRIVIALTNEEFAIESPKALGAVALTVDFDREWTSKTRSVDEFEATDVSLLPQALRAIQAWAGTLGEDDRQSINWLVAHGLITESHTIEERAAL